MAALDAAGIKYLVIGGIALGYHGVPRFTKDLDVLVHIAPPDHEKLFECLRAYGAPVGMVTPGEFLEDDFIFYFGSPPWRVDILTSAPGIDFEAAYHDRTVMPMAGYMVQCLSREWLIRSKLASGRPQDLLDVESLRTKDSP